MNTGSKWGQGRGGRPWRRLVEAVKRRDGLVCQCCARLEEKGNCDHIVPTSKGGQTVMANLQWLCIPCHDVKTAGESGMARTAKTIQPVDIDGWPMASNGGQSAQAGGESNHFKGLGSATDARSFARKPPVRRTA